MISAQWIFWKRIMLTRFICFIHHTESYFWGWVLHDKGYICGFFGLNYTNLITNFDKPCGTILYWLSMLSFQFLLFGSLFIIVPFKWFPRDITFLLATCYLTIGVLENPFPWLMQFLSRSLLELQKRTNSNSRRLLDRNCINHGKGFSRTPIIR